MPQGHTVFDELSRLLGSKPYFAGDRFTLADLLVAPTWTSWRRRRNGADDSAPAQPAAWLERMNARPSLQATTMERVAGMAKAA